MSTTEDQRTRSIAVLKAMLNPGAEIVCMNRPPTGSKTRGVVYLCIDVRNKRPAVITRHVAHVARRTFDIDREAVEVQAFEDTDEPVRQIALTLFGRETALKSRSYG